eukprot:s3653_g4.t1
MPSPARLERLHERLTSFGQGQQWQRCLNLLTACSSESITIKTLRVTGNRQYGPNLTRLQCMATGSCLRDCVRGKQKPIPKEMFHSVLFPTTISYNIAMASAWGRKAKAGRKKGHPMPGGTKETDRQTVRMKRSRLYWNHNVLWNSIRELALKPWSLVLHLLDELRQQGLRPRTDTYNAAMSVCAKAHQTQMALQLMYSLRRRQLRQHQVTFNTAIDACAKTQQWQQSLALLAEMSDAALQPDVANLPHWKDLPRHSLQPNWVIFNAAIDSCHRGASWQAALILLQRARNHSVLPLASASWPQVLSVVLAARRCLALDGTSAHGSDQTAYALAIGSCEAAMQWELALSVLATMQHEGPSPNLVLGQQVRIGIAVSQARNVEMRESNLAEAVTLNAAVMALATAGRTAEALCVVRHAEDLGLVSGAWQADANPTLPQASPTWTYTVFLQTLDFSSSGELARFTVLAAVLDAAIDPSRKRGPGLVFVTGRGTHGGTAVLKAVIGECLKEFGLAVEDGCSHFQVLDAHFNIKVCDFGKTQELRSNCAIITGQDTGGSPRYMAPECFMLGAHITEKVDIWSLGCCLVEVLGGPLPYEEIPAMSEVQSLLQRGVPPLVPQWQAPFSTVLGTGRGIAAAAVVFHGCWGIALCLVSPIRFQSSKRTRTMLRLAIVLALAEAAGSFELTPEGYAEILATNSPEKKEEFIETVVTQQLHGFVTSDAGLKSFAANAPASWSALLSQLQGLPWLCGGATGHLCDDPLTAPLGPDGWASVLRANVTARSILAKRIAEDRLNAKVTNQQQLMEWARSAPDTWDTALAELKAAEFLCGGETMRRRLPQLAKEVHLGLSPTCLVCTPAGPMAPLEVVPLDLHEDSARQSVIELLTSAFHEDPGFEWVVGSEPGSDGQYLRYITWVLSLAAHVVPAVGGMALGALSEEALLGVALLLPPGVQLEDAGLGKLIGPGGPVGSPPFKPSKETESKDLLAWARAARRRDRAFGRSVGEIHRAVASMPHWYLWFLGVHPDAQGQGVGAALLAEIQQIQDRDRVPCYLDGASGCIRSRRGPAARVLSW